MVCGGGGKRVAPVGATERTEVWRTLKSKIAHQEITLGKKKLFIDERRDGAYGGQNVLNERVWGKMIVPAVGRIRGKKN